MSGLDVEALLESTAEASAKSKTRGADEHRSSKSRNGDTDDHYRRERSERDRERYRRDGSRRDRSQDRSRDRYRERDRGHRRDRDGDIAMDSPRSERADGGSLKSYRSGHRRDSSRDGRSNDLVNDDDYYHRRPRHQHYRSRSGSPRDDRHYRPHRARDDRGGRGDRRDFDRDRRDRSPGHGYRRRSPSPVAAKPKSPTPQPTEDERDRRTVFVQQLAARLRTKELIAFFEKVGPVKEAQIVKDRVSGRSKGVGYVEFKQEESVALAIQLTGQKLLGIPIIAQLTEAEKNRQARNTESSSGGHGGHQAPFHRLYVGNIHFSITESDLQNVFEPFGELEFVQLQKEEMGRSRGYGFVQFRDPTQAKEALEKMNGFDLAGRPIRVGLGNDKFTPETTANLLQRFQGQDGGPGQGQQRYQGSAFSGQGGRGVSAAGSAFDRASGGGGNARDDGKGGAGGASALDDSDVAGVNFSNYSRDALMRKLARTDDSGSAGTTADGNADGRRATVKPKPEVKPLPVAVSQTSRCVLLRNMFNPQEEEGESWVKELEDDVRAECNEKYGKVVHISLDPNTQGDIYLKFDRVTGGENAIKGLNGRFFGGRQITAQPVVDAVYSSLFSRASAL